MLKILGVAMSAALVLAAVTGAQAAGTMSGAGATFSAAGLRRSVGGRV